MRTETSVPVHLRDYRPTDYQIDAVEMDVSLDPSATRVKARLSVRRRQSTAPGTPLVLDGDELTLRSVALDGIALGNNAYGATPEKLVLHAPPQGPFVLEIETELDPAANTKLMGLYRSSTVYCTQCEAEGFRRITYFLDRPDVLSVYTTRLEAAKADAPVLLSNGNLVAAGDVEGTDRHYAVWHDPFPKPAYLFAMVGGDLGHVADSFTTMSGRTVDLRIYVEHGKEPQSAYAMDALKRSMKWDEEAFGREYDLDVFMIVAVSDFNMGAMENKGLNVFNDKYVLADPDTATDQDYQNIEGVIAHEYFHNWTGNRITCRDWFQLCLKEGLTVFRDQEFSSDQRSRPVKRIADVRTLRAQQFPEDQGPLAHPVRPETYLEINNFYTATVYEKGAEVIRMLKTLIGDAAFRAGMDLYFERHDGEAATVEQFVACFAESSGRDLSHFMRWYSQAGTPIVDAEDSYEPATRRYTLRLTQTNPPTPGAPEKGPLVVPIRFGLVGPDGGDVAYGRVSGAEIAGDVLVLDAAAATVVFEDVAERPVPSLLRGFSAPVTLRLRRPADDLVFLMRHDADPFNRWQASSSLAMLGLLAGAEAVRNGRTPAFDPGFLDGMRAIAADGRLDHAFRALVLTIPSENDVAREAAKNVDPEAIGAAWDALRRALGTALGDMLRGIEAGLRAPGEPYSPDAASAGRRALANAALGLLTATGEPEAIAFAARRYAEAANMTDRLAALAALVLAGPAHAAGALDDFYGRYKANPLVIDKWLSVQAAAPWPDALERVEALTRHPAFTMRNPNRIRSLIGTFSAGNPRGFHRADGAGHAFLADVVIALDETNPQVAARLLTAFRTWRTLEPVRRASAQAALARVLAKPNLSRDVTDIAERALGRGEATEAA